jgi:2-iminoacetate synthase
MLFKKEFYKIPDEKNRPFIDDDEIWDMLNNAEWTYEKVRQIIAKSLNKETLTLQETAILLQANDKKSVEAIKQGARDLKKMVYGNRIVLFAPLYIGNKCTNNCQYCGFRTSNKDCIRVTLSDGELINEVKNLEDEGQKRLILVYGEHPNYNPEFIAHTARVVYSVKNKNGEIRRVNINAAPLDVEGFRTVKAAGIGTYQIFQETYHHEAYKKFHKGGKKMDYDWRITAFDRAFEAGIDDVGLGALFGLYDWRFEVMGLVRHTKHLESCFGVGPHTISFPRIQEYSDSSIELEYKVNDEDFLKLIAVIRLSVPYTGMILTARESEKIRKEAMAFGVSQIDGGTKLEIGAYSEDDDDQDLNREQFQINDNRKLSDIISDLAANDYIPSFCTACYRIGRTGEHFMEFSVPGFIKRYCTPNAILTFAEYLNDYADNDLKKNGFALIEKELSQMDINVQTEMRLKLQMIANGKKDLYY